MDGIATGTQERMTLALCAGYFLVLLDVTVVNVTLPSIGTGLHATSADLAWVVDAYTVPLAALLLVAGAIGDRVGHRAVVLTGFAGFGAASVACALAPGVPVLVGGRALQGVSAALMLPGTLALLTSSAGDDRTRARIVGVWAAVGGAALPAGPFVGGLISQTVGWRGVFWLNVPVIVAAMIPVLRAPRDRRRAAEPINWLAAGVLVGTLGAAVTAIIEKNLIIAAVAVLLVPVVWRTAPSLLAVPRGAARPLTAACVVAGLMNFCVLGSLFLLTQIFQTVHGLSPLTAGLLLLPGMLPLPLLATPAARLVHRYGPWRTAALGLGLSTLGFAGMALSVGRPVYPVLLVALAVWGSGLGVLTPAIVTAAMRTTPETPGIASGASNTARQTGGALGVALFAAIAGSAAAASFTQRGSLAIGGSALVFAAAALYGFQADQRFTLISTKGPAGSAS